MRSRRSFIATVMAGMTAGSAGCLSIDTISNNPTDQGPSNQLSASDIQRQTVQIMMPEQSGPVATGFIMPNGKVIATLHSISSSSKEKSSPYLLDSNGQRQGLNSITPAPAIDLAVLTPSNDIVPNPAPLSLSESNPSLDTECLIMGHPRSSKAHMEASYTLTQARVTHPRTYYNLRGILLLPQGVLTSADPAVGFSGGPVVDARSGDVYGLLTRKTGGLSIAISSPTILSMLGQPVSDEGLQLPHLPLRVTASQTAANGLHVTNIIKKDGVKAITPSSENYPGDRIIKVDGVTVQTESEFWTTVMTEGSIGEQISITYIGKEAEKEQSTTLPVSAYTSIYAKDNSK